MRRETHLHLPMVCTWIIMFVWWNGMSADWEPLAWVLSDTVPCVHRSTYLRFVTGCGIRRRSATARLLGLRVRIPLTAWMFVSCVCCTLCSSLCDQLITRSEKYYWFYVCVCLIVCDLESSTLKRRRSDLEYCAGRRRRYAVKGRNGARNFQNCCCNVTT